MIEEVEMCAHLIIPRHLGLVGNRLVHLLVVVGGMGHIVVATHRLLAVGIQLGLEDVAEHLYVVTTSPISLAHRGIHVALLVIDAISQPHLGQELVVIILRPTVEKTSQGIGGCLSHHVGCHRHEG